MAGPWEQYQGQEKGPWSQYSSVSTEPEVKPDTGFTGAAKSSYEMLKGEAALLAGKTGIMGLEEAEKYYLGQQDKARKAFKPTEEGWTEAPLTKFKELLGGSVPYMAAPLAAGAAAAALPVTGVAGTVLALGAAGAASATQFTGSNLSRQMDTGKSLAQTDLLNAGATAIPQAALDTLSFKLMPGIGRIFNQAGVKISDDVAQEVAKKGIAATAGEYALSGAKIAGIEGGTEAAQQFFERLQAGLNIADEEARKEYFESFVGGAVLGGTIGVGGRAYERAFPRKETDLTKSTLQEKPLTTPTTLALPSPEEIILNEREYDPLKNPIGNFSSDELTPEQIKYIDTDRKANGKPKLKSYSLEDLVDAVNHSDETAAAKQGIIDNLLTVKTGYTGEVELTPDDIYNVSRQKNVETKTQGFNDFLRRATGSEDVMNMSQPQLFSAFEALSKLDTSPELMILPEGTNAVRFSEKQYENALRGLESVYDEFGTSSLGRTSVIQEIKDFAGLERDADAEALYRQAIRRNDLEENLREIKTTEGTKTVSEVSFSGKVEPLPSGFDIRYQSFKQGVEPESYEVKNGSVVIQKVKTAEEAQKVLDKQTKINEQLVKRPEAEIAKIEKAIANRNNALDIQRAKGFGDTLGFRKLAAEMDARNKVDEKSIEVHRADIQNFTNPLKIEPVGEKPITSKKYVFYEGDKPLASFGDKYQAEEFGIMKLDEGILGQIIETGPKTKGVLPKRYAAFAAKEMQRRRGELPKGIEVKKSIYTEKVDENLDKLRQQLLPAMKRFGLEKVGLRIVNSIADGKADGSYVQALIKIAVDAKNPMGTLRHESIHALKELGAFTPEEWKVLTNKAKSEWIGKYIKPNILSGYREQYLAENKNLKGFDEYIQEEAIAEAFADFANTKAPAGLIGNLFSRLKSFFEALGNAFKRLGFNTAADVFKKVERGEAKPTRTPVSEKEKLEIKPEQDYEIVRKGQTRGLVNEQVTWQLKRKSDGKLISEFDRRKDAQQMLDVYTLPQEEVFAKYPDLKPKEKMRIKEEIRKIGENLVGSPPDARTVKDRAALVKKMTNLLEHPYSMYDDSKDWYERSGDTIRQVARGDVQLMEKIVRLMSIYSQANSLGGNVTALVKSLGQLARGEPTAVAGRFPEQTSKIIPEALAAKEFDTNLRGVDDKLMNFYRNLHDGAFKQNTFENSSTIDRWMMRLFGYPHSEDREVGGANSVSATQYKYAKDLIRRIADANEKKTGEKLAPRQIQAVLWTYVKNTSDAAKIKDEGKKFEPKAIDFSDYINRATANITWESRPSTSIDLIPGIHKAPRKDQDDFNRAVRKIFENKDGSSKIFELLKEGVLYSSQNSIGAYENQIAPNVITRLVLEKDEKGHVTELADKAAAIIGYVTKQDAVPWYRADPTASGKMASKGYKVITGETITPDFEDRLFKHLDKEMPGIGFTRVDNSFDFINFRGDNGKPFFMSDKEYITKLQNALETFSSDVTFNIKPFKTESAYISNNWKEDINGEGYLGRFGSRQLTDIQPTLDDWSKAYTDLANQYGKEYGWDKRERGGEAEGGVEPTGERLQIRAPETKEFKEWFGDSKVVDEKGKPLLVYRGQRRDAGAESTDLATRATPSFTDNKYVASVYSYAKSKGQYPEGAYIAPSYVKMVNPIDLREFGNEPKPLIDLLESSGITGLDESPDVALKILKDLDDIQDKTGFESNSYSGDYEFVGEAYNKLDNAINQNLDADTLGALAFDILEDLRVDAFALPDSPTVVKYVKEYNPRADGFIVRDAISYSAMELMGKENLKTLGGDSGYDAYRPFEQNQIKSAFNQKPTESKDVRYSLRAPETPEFKDWIGDSVAIDENFNPILFYHGTDQDFTTFKPSKEGALGKGIYITPDPEYAGNYTKESQFGEKRGTGANVIPLYARVENPLRFNYKYGRDPAIQALETLGLSNDKAVNIVEKAYEDKGNLTSEIMSRAKKVGHDAIFYMEEDGKTIREAVVFEPNQLKSVFNQKPSYSADIRFSLRDTVDPSIWGSVDRTTTKREEKGFIQRLLSSIFPDSAADFRFKYINALEGIERQTTKKGGMFGEKELLAENSALAAALQSMRAAGVAASSFRDGIPVYDKGYTYVTDNDGKNKGLIPIFEPLAKYGDAEIYRLFQFYAATRRGKRLMADGRERLFTPDDITKGNDLEKQFPEFKTVFNEYQIYNKGLVDYMKATGVISDAEAKIWTQNWDYIPFYRQLDGESTAGPKVFSSLSGVSKPKKLKGGEEELADFMETIVRNSRAAIEAGMKNEAARRAVRDAKALGTAQELKESETGNDIVNIKENGKTKYYRVDDPLLVKSMQALNMPQLELISFLGKPAELLRNFVTKDPGFILANLGRDSLQAWITSGTKMRPVVDTFQEFGNTLFKQSPVANALARAGMTGYDFAGDVKSTSDQVMKELRKRGDARTTGEKALLPITALWDALEQGSHASDMATRVAIYKQTLERTGSEAEAMYQAMEVLNFSRRGASPTIRMLAAMIPFLNARIQGLDVLYRSGWGKMATENKDVMKKAFAVRALTMMGMSMLYWFLVSDTEEYERLTKEERDNYWIVPGVELNGKPFRFPIPFELGVVFKVIPERVLETAFGSDTGKDLKESMFRQLTGTLGVSPPQAFLPILENLTNYSLFTGEPLVGRGLQDLEPKYQFTSGTSQMSKDLGAQLNISPIKIENLVRGYTGTLGTYAVQALDAIYRGEGDPVKATMRTEQMPVIKRFFATDSGTVAAYYDLKEEVDTAVRTVNFLERTGDMEGMREYLEGKGKVYLLKDYVRSLENDMKQIREARRVINESKDKPADEKREYLDRLHDMEIQLTQNIRAIRKQN